MKFFKNGILFYLVFILSGCAGGNADTAPATTPLTTVSGVVFAGAHYTSGLVSVYDFTTGAKGRLLKSGSLDSTGAYQLNVQNIPSAILVEVSNGCYVDNALPWNIAAGAGVGYAVNNSTATVCASSITLSAVVSVTTGAAPLVVAVTPYTNAAFGLAQYYKRMNTYPLTGALNNANLRVSQWVGVDIIKTLPTEPNRNTVLGDGAIYGVLISGIPTWIYNVPGVGGGAGGVGFGTTYTSLGFADAMKSDLAQDGVFNGTGRDANGNSVTLQIGAVPMSTSVYRHELAQTAAMRFRSETEGATSPNSSASEKSRIVDFLPALLAFNSATNMFDNSAVLDLDNNFSISYTYPSIGAVLSNNDGVVGRVVADVVGILNANAKLYVDGVYYTTFNTGTQYSFNQFINTTVFANGAHTLTVTETNNLGHARSVSVNVTFSN